ncbi:helix-hairpin-helix domain-containing protein [Clostridium formicaceticum]|uniref:ComE operon protein 1 n=1 Tax=Clostridium formicaceticum TaxID=1497 RepID=A0AAC9WH51_9CLOT|nr:helix-hairpin-helix domain-containing protein [Clostridium formicaceticum]AOY76880.1 hypothetical protein BJL90_14075 [Clostridium formicaceticum]ARE87360.1 ComE operon protein 1 [Clostridium formicaceticum]
MVMKLNHRQKLIMIIFIVIVFAFIFYTNQLKRKKEIYILSESQQETVIEYQESQNETKTRKPTIIVHVEGEVIQPGVYELPEESRVFHAIEAAGGLKSTADRKQVNLAKKILDEEKIYIPTEEENLPNSSLDQVVSQATIVTTSVGSNGLDINKASKEELESLPGIGNTLAQRIIDYRSEKGGFQRIEELQNVSGIGEKKFSEIKDKITVK